MGQIVGTFEIPEEIAKELSTLLVKQSIREKLLENVVNDPDKYNEIETMLIPLVKKIDVLKHKITNELVPEQFCDEKYMWNYDGFDIAGTTVQVYEK